MFSGPTQPQQWGSAKISIGSHESNLPARFGSAATLSPFMLTLTSPCKERVFKTGKGIKKQKVDGIFWCGGIERQLVESWTLKKRSHFLSLCFLCLHKSTMPFRLSSLARELSPCRCGVSSSLLLRIIAVGNHGSYRSPVKRAKICSQNKSSSTAVAAANHGAVTHFLPVSCFGPIPPLTGAGHRGGHTSVPLALGTSAERVQGSFWGRPFRVRSGKSLKLP